MNNKNHHQDNFESYGRQDYQQSSLIDDTSLIGTFETQLLTSAAHLDNSANLDNYDSHDRPTNNDDLVIANEEQTPQVNSIPLSVPNLSSTEENTNSSVQIQVENLTEQENTIQRYQQNALSLSRIVKLSNHKMASLKGFIGLNAFGHLIGFLTEANVLSYPIVFIGIILMSLIMLVRMIRGYHDPSFAPYRRKYLFFQVSNWVCLAAYFVMAILKYNGVTATLSLWTVPGCLSIFVESFAMASTYTSGERGLEISLKHVIWIQLFIAALKVDNATSPWTFTLFVFISFGFVSVMLAIILLVVCISAGMGVSYYNLTGKTVVMGTGWYFLISFSNVLWGAMVIYTENMLNTLTHEIPLKTFFFAGLLYSILLLALTKIFNKTLLIFLKYEAIQELQEIGELSSHNYTILLPSDKKPKHQYLTKITGTYYTTLEKSLQIKEKEVFSNLNGEMKHANSSKFSLEKRTKTCPKSAPASPTKITDQLIIKKSISLGNIDSVSSTKRNQKAAKFEDEANIEERDLCFVCYEADANAVIMDCGHGGICYECAARGWERCDKCHICRTKIRNIVKVKILPKMKLVKVVDQIEKMTVRYYICNL